MQSIFDKLGKAASTAAAGAASKAEEMREINRLRGEQNEMKTEYTVTKKKLSEYVFKQYQEGNLTDSALIEFCDKMQELRDGIDELGKEIEAVKAEYEEKASVRGEERL